MWLHFEDYLLIKELSTGPFYVVYVVNAKSLDVQTRYEKGVYDFCFSFSECTQFVNYVKWCAYRPTSRLRYF